MDPVMVGVFVVMASTVALSAWFDTSKGRTMPERLMRWLSPCLHEYETVATLMDRPDNPTATKIIQVCKLCGSKREETFRAPEEAKGPCRHRWVTIHRMPVRETKDADPIHYDHEQRCERCGDLRLKRL